MVNVNDPLIKEKTDANVSKQLSDVTCQTLFIHSDMLHVNKLAFQEHFFLLNFHISINNKRIH